MSIPVVSDYTGLHPALIKDGDKFTIAGVHQMVANPERRFWQWWKPRFVPGNLKVFTVRG